MRAFFVVPLLLTAACPRAPVRDTTLQGRGSLADASDLSDARQSAVVAASEAAPSPVASGRERTQADASETALAKAATAAQPGLPVDAGLASDRHGRAFSAEFGCIVGLLEYLATRNEFRGVFDATKTKDLDVPRLLAHVSPDGLLLREDTPPPRARRFPKRQVEAQLRKRQGEVFVTLAHIGTNFSVPSPVYSELRFEKREPSTVVANVGARHYELIFTLYGDACQLSEIHYQVMEWE